MKYSCTLNLEFDLDSPIGDRIGDTLYPENTPEEYGERALRDLSVLSVCFDDLEKSGDEHTFANMMKRLCDFHHKGEISDESFLMLMVTICQATEEIQNDRSRGE